MKTTIGYFFLAFTALFSTANAHHSSWKIHSKADSQDSVQFHFVLPQNQDGVKTLVNYLEAVSNPDSPNYRQWMRDNPSKLTSAPFENRLAVSTFAFMNDIDCIDLFDTFVCTASVEKVEEIFSVDMYNYHDTITGGFALRASNDYVIPEFIAPYVEWVNGISNRLFPLINGARPNGKMSANQTNIPDSGFVARENIMSLYSLGDALVVNPLMSGAAIEFNGSGYTQAGLNESMLQNGLPAKNVYKIVGKNFGGGVESLLDMNMLAYVAGNLQLWYFNFVNWIYDFAVYFSNTADVPKVVSISYGWAEKGQCMIISCTNDTAKQYIERTNIELAKVTVRGITVVVASGDAGSPGRTNEECDTTSPINPVYPGSSPYVLSVGATYVVADKNPPKRKWNTPICQKNDCASGSTSKVINQADVGWTTGAGFGIYSEPTMSFQEELVHEYLNTSNVLPKEGTWNRNGRGYPDVTANGHECATMGAYFPGNFTGVDGTSCSAPTFAAFIVLANDYEEQNKRPPLGYVNPLLYKLASGNDSPFTQPLGGNTSCTEYSCCNSSFGFTTTDPPTRWSPPTGLGELNYTKFTTNLNKLSVGYISRPRGF